MRVLIFLFIPFNILAQVQPIEVLKLREKSGLTAILMILYGHRTQKTDSIFCLLQDTSFAGIFELNSQPGPHLLQGIHGLQGTPRDIFRPSVFSVRNNNDGTLLVRSDELGKLTDRLNLNTDKILPNLPF